MTTPLTPYPVETLSNPVHRALVTNAEKLPWSAGMAGYEVCVEDQTMIKITRLKGTSQSEVRFYNLDSGMMQPIHNQALVKYLNAIAIRVVQARHLAMVEQLVETTSTASVATDDALELVQPEDRKALAELARERPHVFESSLVECRRASGPRVTSTIVAVVQHQERVRLVLAHGSDGYFEDHSSLIVKLPGAVLRLVR